jgi:hypothetical protein
MFQGQSLSPLFPDLSRVNVIKLRARTIEHYCAGVSVLGAAEVELDLLSLQPFRFWAR